MTENNTKTTTTAKTFKWINLPKQTDLNQYVVYKAEVIGSNCPPYYGYTKDLNRRINSHKHLTFSKNDPNKNYAKSIEWRKEGVTKENFMDRVKFTVVYMTFSKSDARAAESALINSGEKVLNDMGCSNKKRAERVITFARGSVQRFINIFTGEVLIGTSSYIHETINITPGNQSNIRKKRKSHVRGWKFDGLVSV